MVRAGRLPNVDLPICLSAQLSVCPTAPTAQLPNMRAGPCARNSGGKLRPSTGAGHDSFDDAEGLLAERMAGPDPRHATVVPQSYSTVLPFHVLSCSAVSPIV